MPLALADIASLASAAAVFVAVVFGVAQVRHLTRTRAIFSSAELVHALQTADFRKGIGTVSKLPDRCDPAVIAGDPDKVEAAAIVGHVFESLGVLVFHGILPLHLVDDLLGGYVRIAWRKLQPYVEHRRVELGVSYGEWMQWLAERMDEHPSPGKGFGAHVAHRKWRP